MEDSSRQICEDLLVLLGRLKVGLATLAESYDLTPPQLSALYAILKGDSTMGRVAGSLHCDASNITGIIDRLVAQDLVTRRESPVDRRTKMLQLTARGQQIMDDIAAKLPIELGCAKLSPSERTTLRSLIGRLMV